MGAIQASSRRGKQRKAVSLDEGMVWSAGKLTRGSNQFEMADDGEEGTEDAVSSSTVRRHLQQHPVNHADPQSRDVGLLREESLEDVDSFVESKKIPEAIDAEASKLLSIQKELGLNHVSTELVNKSRLVEMEIRDQQKKVEYEEETKLEEASDALCYGIWGGEDCNWAFYPSVGNSGGILSIWRKSVSSLIFSFTGDGYVGVCLDWGVQKNRCFLLLDLPVLGRKFTWFHPNGRAMSRIDRALVSEDWLTLWGQPSLWVLPRSVSDHCPLILRCGNVDWGPRPFRFNNHWLQNDDFKRLVEETWREQDVEGWMRFILKEKLKGLKTRTKVWNKEVYGGIDLKIKKLMEDIEELDVRGELGILTEEEVKQRKHTFGDL
ncbi:cysteine-rich receptor-like protein kinase, partial [Trifolium pratense]